MTNLGKEDIIKTLKENSAFMQVSPSGMAAASQAVPGEFDSRHLLQKQISTLHGCLFVFGNRRILTGVEGGENRGSDLFAR